ncbi:MAG: hypothetical protein AB7E60_09505 [Sphingobium sp.]
MVDTPDTPPVKRGKKAGDTTRPAKAKLATAEVVNAVPVQDADTYQTAGGQEPDGDGVARGWTAPLKAQAEKAAKSAADTLNAVDWKAHIDPIKEQAGKTARSAAVVAKDKTGSAMHSVAKLISDTAATVDSKLGPQYGDYARQAAESVAGAADKLDSKDVDALMTEARDFVRKSPAVAIGAAAVVGFVLMRLAKGSDDDKA